MTFGDMLPTMLVINEDRDMADFIAGLFSGGYNVRIVSDLKCPQEKLAEAQPQIIINNDNTNTNTNTNTNNNYGAVPRGREKNKWVALLLCLFLGGIGAHKFYEGKIVMGIIYLFTAGLFGIGVLVDFISLLFKKNPYYV